MMFGVSAHYINGRAPRQLRVASNARPVNNADMAQARLFEVILADEIVELEQLVESAAERCRRNHIDGVNPQLSEELVRLRNRLREAQRLLTALRNRFP
jgi:hypothetical protein